MKKYFILLLTFLLVLPLFATNSVKSDTTQKNPVNTAFTQDRKIDIEITKDGNRIKINHTSGLEISHAVVEYARMEGTEYVSRLEIFEVNKNIFEVPSNTQALKVHQIKTLINRVYYTYSTSNNNSIGSFSNVVRKNITEIKTTAVEVVKLPLHTSAVMTSSFHKYYEFYFDFDKEHDLVESIDVNYVVIKKGVFGGVKDKYNVSKNINTDIIEIEGWFAGPGIGASIIWDKQTYKIKGLEPNSKIGPDPQPGNYVTRVFEENKNYLAKSYEVENFAIVRISYYVDGEFIVDDVINEPVTPEDENIDWLMNFIEQLKAFVEKIGVFFGKNGSVLTKIIMFILIVLILAPVIFVIKLLLSVIKTVFKVPGLIASVFKLLFVPTKKNNRNERKRY